MFQHIHPYPPFLFPAATKWIVGTLPPPRFTTGQLKDRDVNFCYGSRDGQLWPIIDRIFNAGLTYKTTDEAINERQELLRARNIGICDIVSRAEREKVNASDLGMSNVVLRDLIACLKHYPNVDTLLFTGGNSKNGPEYFFRKLIRAYGLELEEVVSRVPRVHQFKLPSRLKKPIAPKGISIEKPDNILDQNDELESSVRTIRTVSLIAPSGSANRAVGSLETYKDFKRKNPEATTVDFRVLQYREYF